MKFYSIRHFLLLTFLLSGCFRFYSQTGTDRDLLKQYMEEYPKNNYYRYGSDQSALKEKIIRLALRITPPPPLSSTYTYQLRNGIKAFASAKTLEDYYGAIKTLEYAIDAAPWMPEAYMNIALTYEQCGRIKRDVPYLSTAVINYKLFLLANTNQHKANEVQARIKNLESLIREINLFNKEKTDIIAQDKANMLAGHRRSCLFRGACAAFDFQIGTHIEFFPAYSNNGTVLKPDTPNTTNGFAMGLQILNVKAEFHPLYTRHFGLGAYVNGTCYILPTNFFGEYGINGFLGFRKYKLLFDMGLTNTRSGIIFTAFGSEKVVYTYQRLGTGIRLDYKKIAIDLMIYQETPDFLLGTTKESPLVFRQNYCFKKDPSDLINLVIEIGWNYPDAGQIEYPILKPFNHAGTLFTIGMVQKINFFSKPYRKIDR
ncbi:MAG: tetratricopeptide repeat protein [Bacteroidia bacterium]